MMNGTRIARKMMTVIFTENALYDCSLYVEPPTGRDQKQRPALNSKAVDIIIGSILNNMIKKIQFIE